MNVFMRNHTGGGKKDARIRKTSSGQTIIARLEMLECVVVDRVAKGEKQIVVVVPRPAEQGFGFGDKPRKMRCLIRRKVQSIFSFSRDIPLYRMFSTKRNVATVLASDQWGVDECFQGDRLELYPVPLLLTLHRQRDAIFPASGKMNFRLHP